MRKINKTVLGGDIPHPGTRLTVLHERSGYYLGFLDSKGEPLTRESRYFRTKAGAESLLSGLLTGGAK